MNEYRSAPHRLDNAGGESGGDPGCVAANGSLLPCLRHPAPRLPHRHSLLSQV